MIRSCPLAAFQAICILALLAACGGEDLPPGSTPGPSGDGAALPFAAPAPLAFDLQMPFVGEAIHRKPSTRVGEYSAFDVLATDMDLDGDVDVLINWHLGDIELFENNPPVLNIVNAPGADRSGLTLQPGVPTLRADWEQDLLQSAAGRGPGVHVWCEDRLNGSLYLVARQGGAPIPLELSCNEKIKVEGLL